MTNAWQRIEAEARGAYLGAGRFPLRAYSELMPPPYVGMKPYTPRSPWVASRIGSRMATRSTSTSTSRRTRSAPVSTGSPTRSWIGQNYDISRKGYHDTLDTMANIDLDYCVAVIAIAIETVADTACARDLG